ncbi:MAG TPA: YraN family protein [Candidatus Limnocylindria bacterium]|nr:YraN family protein [Candidatus Limnocylindria bacterium]
MGDPRHVLGLAAEEAVAGWLAAAGWQILARRWKVPEGELDLVALDPDAVLVGVEVRARRTTRTGGAAASLDRRHVARRRAALVRYVAAGAPPHRGLRLDLVTVEPAHDEAGRRWCATRLPAIDAW